MIILLGWYRIRMWLKFADLGDPDIGDKHACTM